ncbi:MAG: VWA domain-containing protein [Acidobacteria bacterium]|nr:VWA domain-containing protein [Acidobacteriota bacterium]MBV9146030.1 VWA domain-containing protein [Acidobacteriota bacterium]MBV9438314.1 VWA domain-containing protein [Acidobacteriota bacterium]
MRITTALCSVALAGAFVSSTFAQDNLPSAPSAALERRRPATPPAQQPAPTSQPEVKQEQKPAAPVLESLDPTPHPAPQQATEAAPPPTPPPASAPAESSQSSPAANSDQTVIRSTVNEVNVVFTVIDKHNHYVKDLKESDFRVLDDKKPPASIRNFSSETNLPLRVGLLIDASNSIRDRFRFEQQAAIEFLNQIIRPNRDQAFVLGFDTTPEITQDFTGNPEKLANGVRLLRPGGGTAMYDAVYGACRDKLAKTESAQGGLRRAIILVSDGEDNQSRVTRDDAIEEAQRAEVIVYAISTNVSGTKTRGDKILETIAEATGGRAFFPFKIEEVSDAFSQIQEELRSQYAISYKPADFGADGKYRSIDIEAVNKKYKVRSRKGYFAPKAEGGAIGGQ